MAYSLCPCIAAATVFAWPSIGTTPTPCCAKAMAPATIGLMATQVNIYISTKFASTEQGRQPASTMHSGSCSYPSVCSAWPSERWRYSVLLKLRQSPIWPWLSKACERRCVAASGWWRFYTLPTAVAFYLLAEPILSVIYQRGAYSAADAQMTAVALRCYAIGLIFYSAVKVVVPVYYALKLARVAVMATVMTVMTSLLLNITSTPTMAIARWP